MKYFKYINSYNIMHKRYVFKFFMNYFKKFKIIFLLFILMECKIFEIWFRYYYVQEISYYVQVSGHNKRYFPVLLAWHSVRELRKLSSCCYYVQFGGHDNYNISTGSPYKYRIVLIVNNWQLICILRIVYYHTYYF